MTTPTAHKAEPGRLLAQTPGTVPTSEDENMTTVHEQPHDHRGHRAVYTCDDCGHRIVDDTDDVAGFIEAVDEHERQHIHHETSVSEIVAHAIRWLGGRADVQQDRVAISAGMSPAQLSQRMTGKVSFTVDEVDALGQALGVAASTIVTIGAAIADGEDPQKVLDEVAAAAERPQEPTVQGSHSSWCDLTRCSTDAGVDENGPYWDVYHQSTASTWDARGFTAEISLWSFESGRSDERSEPPTVNVFRLSNDDTVESSPDDLEAFGRWLAERAAEYRQAIATDTSKGRVDAIDPAQPGGAA